MVLAKTLYKFRLTEHSKANITFLFHFRLEYPNAENAENLPDYQRTNAASSRKRISQDQQDQKGTHGAGLQKQTTEHFGGPKKRRRR